MKQLSFMTNFSSDSQPVTDKQPVWWGRPRPIMLGIGVLLLALYLATMARGLVLGDPTEYTFVANLPAIAHPPGYAFITLIGWLFQHSLPLGDFPWRMHLVAVTAGTIAALAVFGIVYQTVEPKTRGRLPAAAAAALLAGTAANIWQHTIHANPHILTAAFLVTNCFFLIRWSILPQDRRWKWLWLFCLSAGLGATHHPLTVFSFPAYALFIIWIYPAIWRDWHRLLGMIGFAALGLLPLLYYPIISGMEPVFGPHTMDTVDGFLAHVLARGLSDSLPYYRWIDQPQRLVVFGSIVRLQVAWPLLILAAAAVWSAVRSFKMGNRLTSSVLFLLVPAFLINYGFVITLKQQDIMAYLLGPMLLIMALIGIGLGQTAGRMGAAWRPVLLAAIFIAGPLWNVLANGPYISLRSFDEGDRYVAELFDYFDGRGEAAVLLNNWEYMTPLWYTKFVEERWPDPNDVRPEFVSAAEPWLPSVYNYLPGGPVYLNGFRPEIVSAGFRLRPRGRFFQVVEPGDTTIPPELISLTDPDNPQDTGAQLLAYELPQSNVVAGNYVPLTLAMRVTEPTEDFVVPIVQVGSVQYEFTTDSHLVSPLWVANEVVVERFDLALPHDLPPGDYPVSVRLRNLSRQADIGSGIPLGTLVVEAAPLKPPTQHLLANFRQRVGLRGAISRHGVDFRTAPWEKPLVARPGDVVITHLTWEVLDIPEESYTVFVHLIDPANRLYAALDYTPLGGAVPTHLWFPKWLPGQRLTDPYRLEIPADLPPGSYLIEVGLYEMISGRRLHIQDEMGNIVGDRYILGEIQVVER